MTLFEILVYFIVIVKAFFGPSNAPVRSTGATPVPSTGATHVRSFGPTPVPSSGATGQAGQAGQAPAYTLSANPKHFAYLQQSWL